MSRLQNLKVFIQQRLIAAVDEVIGHLQRTISEYEEEMKCEHSKLLVTGSKPDDELHTAVLSTDVQQHLVIKKEGILEQQKWIPSLDQENPEGPKIKEEKQDYWTPQEFGFSHVHVKSEDGEEQAQTSQLHQSQTKENKELEPPASSSTEFMKTECDGEDRGGLEQLVSGFKCLPGSDYNMPHCSTAENQNSGDVAKEIGKPHRDLNTIKNKAPVNDIENSTTSKAFGCSKCGKGFGQKHHLQTHMRCHTGEKPFSCSLCGKRFTQKGNLTQHLTVHTREKPCSCPVCGERFAQKGNLTQHLTVHTREKFCW